ncbi:MAG TPA: membrane protein insertase YidC, partial [Prolixibacteraceae bacterium]|nr:membrane protein insertase YidC [Prolixibacteraceae bacterium]
MDKNSIIGIVLIFAVLVVTSIVTQPSKEKIAAARKQQDSLQRVEMLRQQQMAEEQKVAAAEVDLRPDSVKEAEQLQNMESQLGVFSVAAQGEDQYYTLENNLVKITFSAKGGKIYSVELKDFKTHDQKPLILFDGPENQFGLNFFSNNRSIQTDQLFFRTASPAAVVVNGPDVKTTDKGDEKFNRSNSFSSESVSFRLQVDQDSYLEYVYTLRYNTFMVDFDVKTVGMNQLIPSNQPYLNMIWKFDVLRQEVKSKFGEDQNNNVFFKYFGDEVDKLKPNKSDEKNLPTRIKWIGMKQLFFNSTIIADESFPVASVRLDRLPENNKILGNFSTAISLSYEGKTQENWGMQFYFGPNHFKTLRQYKMDLERHVNLGYSILRPVNRYLII